METTTFRLVLTAQDAPAVPNTGLVTSAGSGASSSSNILGIVILAIFGIAVVALAISALIARKKKAKNGFGLIAGKSTMLFRSLIGIMAIGALGYVGINSYLNNDGANAATVGVNVESLGSLTVEGEIDPEETVIHCGTDVVKLPQATPAGYTLYMRVPEGKLVL